MNSSFKTDPEAWVFIDRPPPDFWWWVVKPGLVQIKKEDGEIIAEGPTSLDCIRQLEAKGLLFGEPFDKE